MKVLLIGSGGREHAIGWKLAESNRVDELVSLPGNPGLAQLGSVVEGIGVNDVGAISAMARIQGVDLVVIGPEAPLAAGLVDALSRLHIPVFGPTRAAAMLEASKAFAKSIMIRAGVPTGHTDTFSTAQGAARHLDAVDGPFVVKADGLAGGKGVLVTDSRHEAKAWATKWIDQGPVVVEEHLEGPEVSVFAVCTQHGAMALEPARDYKRLLAGDEGPNTGGMGAYSPVPDLSDDLIPWTIENVVEPVLHEMDDSEIPFRGFLYTGLVLTRDGPKVLEFNVRLGDPETQAILPRMKSDLVDVLEGAKPEWHEASTVNVVLAAEGYPESPVKGARISGLGPDLPAGVMVFHAGTRSHDGRIIVDGGRVLSVVGSGSDLARARERAYDAVSRINWPGMQFRLDIAG